MTNHWNSFLLQDLEERKKLNPKYSLRAFAAFLKVSPSQLSKILNGKKSITPKMALNLAEVYSLSATETLQSLNQPSASSPTTKTNSYFLKPAEFDVLMEWTGLAILTLADLKPNSSDPHWIAHKLGISVPLAAKSLANLIQKKFIEVYGGQLYRIINNIRTEPDFSSEFIRRFHRQILRMASEKLETVEPQQREYGSFIIPIHRKRIPAAKKLIRKFFDEFCDEFENGKKTDIYNLSIQFFPITLTEKDGN